MITTEASHEQVARSLPDIEVPLQRSAPPARMFPVVPPARTRRRWPAAVGGVMAGLAVGTAGAVGAIAVVASRTATIPAPPSLVADSGAVANVSVPGRVLTTFGNGTWQVGIDIAPGTYATTGAADGTSCYRALRTGSARGNLSDRAVAPEPATVVLTEDDGWFETSGCATWRRVR